MVVGNTVLDFQSRKKVEHEMFGHIPNWKREKTPLDENDYVESLAEKFSSMQSKVECLCL